MTTSEKRFVLKEVFENIESTEFEDKNGEEKEHFRLRWNIKLSKNEDHYNFGLFSDYWESAEWSADTEFEFRLIGKEVFTSKGIYYHNESDEDWDELMTVKESQIENYLIDGNLTVECHVRILKTEGIKGMKSKFDRELMKKYSDVVLVVDGEKFYVSKSYLATRSPYFESLLMGQFKESNQSEVVLQGIEVEDFQNFLEILYAEPAISDRNVESVLRVADMYETECVMKQAEEFLLEVSKKSKKEKFGLAVKFNLDNLKESILSKCVNAEEIRSLLPDDLTELDYGTMAELFQKYISATTYTFRIFVRTRTGRTIKLDVHSNDTIESVKSKVQESEGISPEKQRLILDGYLLEDGTVLGDHNIKIDSTIDLIPR